jgi:hypothetical protein
MLVGWDWAGTAHDVTVIDDAGAVVDRWTRPHTEAELSDALVRLGRSGRPEELPAARTIAEVTRPVCRAYGRVGALH